MSITISTDKAKLCSKSDIELCRLLFNNNPTIKNLFKININKILKEVFNEYHFDKGEYSPGEMSGVYDFEIPGRSVINKLNTNYSAFCVLLRDVNRVLKSMEQPIIYFNGLSQQDQIIQVIRLNQFIYDYKDRIFDINSSTFQTIMMVLGQTHAWGQKREDNTIIKLKNLFGESNVNPIGKLGGVQDMIGGVDCEVITEETTKTAQIKPFSYIKTSNGVTYVMGSGNVKKYNTDWIIFSKNDKTIIFKNNNTNIVNGNFVFPESNLIYTL